MSLDQVIAWLLILSIYSALCSSSTAISGTAVSEYASTHEASQSSTPLEDHSVDNSLEPGNSYDTPPQITSTLQPEGLSSMEESPQSSVLPFATDEISNSVNPTLVTTLLKQTTVVTGMLESTENSVLQDVTSENSMSVPTLIPSVVSSTLSEASDQIVEPSSTLVETSSSLVESTQSPAESPTVLSPSLSTISESLTDFIELSSIFAEPVSDIGGTLSYSFNDLTVSTSWLQTGELPTVSESTNMSLIDFISPSMQPSSDSAYGFLPPPHTESFTISLSSFDYFTSVETMMSLQSVNETITVFDSASIDSTIMPSESVNEMEPTTLSEHEVPTDSFLISNSSSGYPSLTLSTGSVSEIIILSTSTLALTDIIASPLSASLIKTTELDVVSPTISHPATSVISTTKITSSSSDLTSPASVIASTPSGQNLPMKSSSGLSTGGKIAIGIIIPLAVIGFVILGVFIYRRYNWTRGSFKNFLQPGVHYRAYTNETFNDDDVSLGGSWRKMSDS